MHELSLCNSIYKIVEQAAKGRQVSVIHMEVGQLRQVVPDTLRYCWGLVSEQTQLAGSVLDVHSVPVQTSCRACSATTDVAERLVLVCGTCGSGDVEVTAGEEFLLTHLDLAEA
jgi:hydrogenase nickel incorporation protein HypA/HybF